MSEILKEIRKKVGNRNITETCSGKSCKVEMVDVPSERVVVDVDLAFKDIGKTGKHCDRILFYMSSLEKCLVVVLIEHKGNTFDSATDVASQLQGGANYVKKKVITGNLKTTCIPILFHGSGTHISQFKKLRRQRIKFNGKSYPISKERCNTKKNLANVLHRGKVLP